MQSGLGSLSAPRPRRWPRRLAVGLALVGLIGVGGYLGIGYYAYEQLTSVQAHCGTHASIASQTPADFVARSGDGRYSADATPYHFTDYRDVSFPSRDRSVTIRGWLAEGPRAAAGPIVILVHGRGSCRRDGNVLLPAGMLHRAGFGVLLVDLRNHGESESDNGRWAGGVKESRDVLGAWDWLISKGYDARRIGLFGVSLGAATVTIATGAEPRVAATWADSSYASATVEAAEYAETQGYPGWVAGPAIPIGRIVGDHDLGSIDPAGAVANLAGRPFFIVHGLADTTIPPHHAVDLAASACGSSGTGSAVCPGGTRIEPWLVPGARHTEEMLLVTDRYRDRLVSFFTGALGSPTP